LSVVSFSQAPNRPAQKANSFRDEINHGCGDDDVNEDRNKS
jgi:hypothetical protein